MTAQKQSLPKSYVLLLAIVALLGILVGCGGGGSGPSPVPTPTPVQTVLLATSTFSTQVGSVGYSNVSPRSEFAGTFKFIARWTPAPPDGQIFLFIIRDPQNDPVTCFNNFNCPQILAKDIGTGSPKQVEIRLAAGERIYFWVRPATGAVTGTIESWFTQN